MQIPAVGTQVTVVAENISRRDSWEPATVVFEGKIAPTYKWLDADYFCMTTNDPLFPIRSIRQERVVSMDVGGNIVKLSPSTQAVIKQGTWQVVGSKGDVYTVTRNGSRWGCNCVAGGFGRTCKHVKGIQAKEAA